MKQLIKPMLIGLMMLYASVTYGQWGSKDCTKAIDCVRLNYHDFKGKKIGVLSEAERPVKVTIQLMCGDRYSFGYKANSNLKTEYIKVQIDPGEEIILSEKAPENCTYSVTGAYYVNDKN